MKRYIALLLVLVLSLSLIACNKKTNQVATGPIDPSTVPENQRYGGVLNTVVGNCADTFDPMYTTGWVSYNWSFPIYENPLAQDDQGNFVPNVCDFELSEDMLTLKLWPREGVTFHDGSAVEVEDVMASIDRSCKLVPNIKKWFAPYYAAEPYIDEEGKAVYTFKEFKVNTLLYFAGWQNWVAVIPKEICEKYGESPINQQEDCIGTGPYKLVNYQTNALYALERYDGYKATTLECGGFGAPKKAYLDKINIWINGDATGATMALLGGDYNIGSLDAEFKDMATQNGLVTISDPASNLSAMAFNTKGNRPVNDINLRLAIAYAMDYGQIMQLYEGSVDETCPMTGTYYTDIFNKAPYKGAANLEKAKEYLAKANYNGEEIILIAGAGSGQAIIWEANLKAVGINAKVEYMESTTLKEFYADNNNPYDCVFFTYEARSNAPCMISSTPRDKFWGSEKKDELFDKISSLPAGSEESIALWQEMAQLWVDECNVLNFCTVPWIISHHKDFVTNFPGLKTFWNSFWVNPSAHTN